ncbi:nucleotidyltransferase domain-containing protein [Metabacillus schmidteae]|uniref:nucleotidyltransferase domain-containing protein n=1 Tax=Metabacillus schmidteae TaxID=2730405 RepID=UPI00158C6297|nr:nucleotidyltransferase domain-containing protein [Metabacillus schmidteae]
MNNVIKNILNDLEKQEQIQILFACESGSRAWTLHEKDSDFDIRFIYKHEQDWYLQLYEERDVLERNSLETYEVVGWDIKKALRLLNKSNPTLLEWLSSPITYRNDVMFTEELKQFAQHTFSPYSVLHHYLSMAKKNYKRLKQVNNSTAKMYLAVLKPLQICKWIIEKDSFPAIGLHVFHNGNKGSIMEKEFQEVILHKQAGLYFSSHILLEYIETSLRTLEGLVKESRKNNFDHTKNLTDFFRKVIS